MVFLQCIHDYVETGVALLGFEQKNFFHLGFLEDLVQFFGELSLLFGDYFSSFSIDDLIGYDPAVKFIGVFSGDRDFIDETEQIENIVIPGKTYRPEEGGHRKFLPAVDVGVEDIVDVSGEFHPGTAERNYPGAVYLGAVGMQRLAEEHPGRPMQLRDNHPFSAVDDESPLRSHHGKRTQIHFALDGVVEGRTLLQLVFL